MVHPNEDYVLNLLEDVGLVTRSQIEKARADSNGATNVVDVLVKDGLVSEADVSRTPRRAGTHGLGRSFDHGPFRRRSLNRFAAKMRAASRSFRLALVKPD